MLANGKGNYVYNEPLAQELSLHVATLHSKMRH